MTRQPPRIFVARHGQTVTNRDGRFCGHSETDLTELGVEQAMALCRRLRDVDIHAAYSSDYSRTIATARIVLEGRGLEPATDARLRELHYGEWELQKESVVRRRYPDQHRLMRAEDPAWRPPGGETMASVRSRTFVALRDIIARHRQQNVLVVSHGTAINCMIAEILGMSPLHTLRFEVTNCALTEVTVRDGRPFVRSLNDRSHLEGIESPT